MRIVLAQALDRSQAEHVMSPPLGLGYLARYASERDHSLEFFYAEGVGEILSLEPDVVGVSALSKTFDIAWDLGDGLRKSFRGPLLLGGVHISSLPTSLPSAFDVGVIGEGEETLIELLGLIKDRGSGWKDYLPGFPGICYHSDGAVISSKSRPLILPLDTIPNPDRAMLGDGWTNLSGGVHSLFTSRGCPFDCGFCSSTRFWKRTRFFSAEYVVAEIQSLYEQYKPSSIGFTDDLFVADRKRLLAIAERLVGLGLAQEINFAGSVRSSEVDRELCRTLKRMNVSGVGLGIESASDRVLELMNKRTTVVRHLEALHMLRDSGLTVYGSFILGYPGETVEDMRKTVSFIEENLGELLQDFEVYPLIPYPGTPVWYRAMEEGLITEDLDPKRYWAGSIEPEHYVYLNRDAPRDIFMSYLFYLKSLSYRNKLQQERSVTEELRETDRRSQELIAAMQEQIYQGAAYGRHLETEINEYREHIAALETEYSKASEHIRELKRLLETSSDD